MREVICKKCKTAEKGAMIIEDRHGMKFMLCTKCGHDYPAARGDR